MYYVWQKVYFKTELFISDRIIHNNERAVTCERTRQMNRYVSVHKNGCDAQIPMLTTIFIPINKHKTSRTIFRKTYLDSRSILV